nr:novel protein [Danio rerio]
MTRSLRQRFKDYRLERCIRKNRLVTKDGHCNIEFGNVLHKNGFAYVLDFWTTLVETRWRFILLYFVASYTLSWLIFGLLWYWLARNNGDLYWQNPPPDHKPCAINVNDMTNAFLNALETQTGMGCGNLFVTDLCPGSVAVLTIQMVVGLFIGIFWCGIVMTKITLPKKRAKTITFSKSAVICPKKGTLCLQIRVANLRKTLMIGSQIYGKLLRTTVTGGETVILDQVSIDFMVDAGKDNLFFMCPLTLYHIIDKSSPFFDMAVDTLHQQDFELVVFLDGMDESTSSSCQVRTSYIPQEIMWGYDFLPIISRSKERRYRVDFSNIAKVVPVPTAHCSRCYHNEPGNHLHLHGTDNKSIEAFDMELPKSTKM